MPGNTRWTGSEKELVRAHWRSAALPQVRAMLPSRSEKAIRQMGWRLSSHRRRNWNDICKPAGRPTMRDIVWAAGVYEGEGSITRRKAHQRSVVIQLSQKDGWLPQRLAEYFGGTARCYGPYETTLGKTTMWRWALWGPRAWGFGLTIYPLLSPRRQQQIREALHRNS